MHHLLVIFFEFATKYKSELKTQFVLSDISTNHNVGSRKVSSLKILSNDLSIKHVFIYAVLLSYDLS